MRGETFVGAGTLAFAAGGRTVQGDVDSLVDGLRADGGDVGGRVLSLGAAAAVLTAEGEHVRGNGRGLGGGVVLTGRDGVHLLRAVDVRVVAAGEGAGHGGHDGRGDGEALWCLVLLAGGGFEEVEERRTAGLFLFLLLGKVEVGRLVLADGSWCCWGLLWLLLRSK